jgi:hypothetical protein
MEIIFAALLAGKALLPAIDRESLDLQARAEALRPRTNMSRPGAATSRPAAKAQRPAATATTTRTSSRPGSVGPLDLGTMTTICREAGGHTNPVAYVTRLSAAYELNATETRSLRSNCAEYLRARAETLRNLRAQN